MKGLYRTLIPVLVVVVLVCVLLNYSISRDSEINTTTTQLDASHSNEKFLRHDEIHSPIIEEKRSPPPPAKKKIAYAITITKDGPFLDGALVLGHSCLKAQKETDAYTAELVAFVTPGVVRARDVLALHGWTIIEKDLPVTLEEISNPVYVKKMKDSGCCGAAEFVKLWAFTLTEYHRVVHLDMDTVLYRNIDELFLIEKDLLYTGDYNMKGTSPVPPVQGGFLVIRPSLPRFDELRAIIIKGDFGSQGWGGSRIGNFWGGQTIQGILAYFYHSVHKGDSHELNRCVYNCMVDNPHAPKTTRCLDGNKTCQDCRLQELAKVATAHFTICQKPWTCSFHNNPKNMVLCTQLHDEWFKIRDDFEKSLHIDPSYRAARSRYKNSLGMCAGYGDKKYIPIPHHKALHPHDIV